MRQCVRILSVVAVWAGLTGCSPLTGDGNSLIDSLLNGVPGETPASSTDSTSTDADTTGADQSAATPTDAPVAASSTTLITGTVATTGQYKLFELGAGTPGDSWTVQADGPAYNRWFIVALFDGEQLLLRRQLVAAQTPLAHILRSSTSTLYLGVTPVNSSSGGDFRFAAVRLPGVAVPAPRPQYVWLNFGGGSNVAVHGRAGISFPAFDSAVLGTAYAGATQQVRDYITATVREDYAPYNVIVMTSDEGPAPSEPHETLYFGANDDRLLGLADSVDQYNSDPAQVALIYVNAFASYAVMELSVEEMSQMIGNTASHELGHLLGLYHTAAPNDLMDTTGTAWDLTGNQTFTTAKLEPSVFPWGYENSPVRLAETLGYNSAPGEVSSVAAKAPLTEKMVRKAGLRAMMVVDLHTRCGTCADPDGCE
jgi:hypothetical protein